MSTTIDERVVEMRFDNKNFEHNVQTSLGTIDKLKQSLNLTGATKGLEDVDAAAKKVNMSALGGAVEAVSAKFSALQVMGITALANITNTAVNAGKRIASALTIDPIKTGFSEYETKINAVQTIMSNTASKGKTMDDVTKVLNELNTYADKTIYNFAEMTRNIGTFTAAGVGLEESAAAIQGIANLAAASGSTSQQASTAMYQLSQALSSGTVKLMDWNSVVNAGMGGAKFQEALKATARENGIAVDEIIEKHGSFRESLTEGWITADILNTTLQKFTTGGAKEYAQKMMEAGKWTQEEADALLNEAQAMEDAATKVKTFTQLWDTLKESAQSGWSQTWEIIVGDFEEAKETLTKFSEVIGGMLEASANARNEVLQGWKDAGGRADLIDSLFNVFEGVMSIVTPIKEAFREIFPPLTIEQLVKFTSGLKELTAKFKISDSASDKLKRTFKGFFAILDIGKQAVSAMFKAVGSLFGIFGDVGGGILDATASMGDWLVKLSESIRKGDVFNKVLQGVVKAIKFVYGAAKTFLGGVLDVFSGFGSIFSKTTEGISTSVDSIGSALEKCTLVKVLQTVWKVITVVAECIWNVIKNISSYFGDGIDTFSLERFVDILNGLIAGGVGIGIMKLISNIGNVFGGVSEIVENISGIFEELGGVLKAYQNDINAKALLKIALSVGILVASLVVLSSVETSKLYDSIIVLGAVFGMLIGSISLISKSAGQLKGVIKTSAILISLAASVLILSFALKTISSLKPAEMATGLIGVGVMVAMMTAVAKILSTEGKSVIKGATQMILFAAAIKILASACISLSSLSYGQLITGLAGIVVLAEVMKQLAESMSTDGSKMIKGAGQMLIMATSLTILAAALKIVASMSWDELVRGMAGIVVLTGAVKVLAKSMSTDGSKMIKGAGQMLIMSTSLTILASALKIIASMSWNEWARGLVGMVVLTGVVKVLAKSMSTDGSKMIKGAGQMLIMATSLTVLGAALKIIASMSLEELARSLVGMAGAIALVVATFVVMDKFTTNALSTAGSMMLMAGAITVFAMAMLILGSMSLESIIKGLVSIAAAFAILGVAGALLRPLTGTILSIAGAFALFGVGVLAIGVGLMAIGAGLSAVAVGITALVGSLAIGASSIVSAILSILTGVVRGLGDVIVAVCEVLLTSMPAIGKVLIVLVKELCGVLLECLPVIVDTVLELIIALLSSLADHTPMLVDSLFRFVIGLIEGLARNTPDLIQAVVDLLMSVFSGAVSALGSIDTETLIEGLLAIGFMTALMIALSSLSALAPAAMVGVISFGAIITELAIVLAAIGALAQIPGLEWIIGEGGDLLQEIGTALGKFAGGIIGGVAEGVMSALPAIGTDLSQFMTNAKPFLDGAKDIDSATIESIASLAEVILILTGAAILEGLTSWFAGESSLVAFGEELAEFGPHFKKYYEAIKGVDGSVVQASANAAKALAEMANEIPNEGGLAALFAGENSLAGFAEQMPALGEGLKGLSDSVKGIDTGSIAGAVEAAKGIAAMADTIPNEGGLVALFTGDNSLAKFAYQMPALGTGLKAFSDSVSGINTEGITAAVQVAKGIADMANTIPNQGGVVSWFTGDNSLASFATQFPILGEGLKGLSESVKGIDAEGMTAAVQVAKGIAAMADTIPNEGGIVSWFTGDNSLASFATQFPILGAGLKGLSESVQGVDAEGMTAAVQVAKGIADMANIIPNEGGLVGLITGENSLAMFAVQLPILGGGLLGFSESIKGISTDNMLAATAVVQGISDMASSIPTTGGLSALLEGDDSLAGFALQLPVLGGGLKAFSDSLTGVNADKIMSASASIQAIADLINAASYLKSDNFYTKRFTQIGEAISTLCTYIDKVSETHVSKIRDIGDALHNFNSIGSLSLASTASSIDSLADSLVGLSRIDSSKLSGVINSIKTIGSDVIDALLGAFKHADRDVLEAGKSVISTLIKGIDSKTADVGKAFSKSASDAVSDIRATYDKFNSAGKYLVEGFAAGISANTYKAEAKARAMAKAAARAAEVELDINSPSRVGYGIGGYFGQGFVNAIDDFASESYSASAKMASSAKNGLHDAIGKVHDFIGAEMDTQPTIRPILDLSDVRAGAGTIGSIFDTDSAIGVSANIGAISTAMTQRNQNGEGSDIVSAINKLRKDLANVKSESYTINGVTYDDGSNITEAVKSIVRAAKIERRV